MSHLLSSYEHSPAALLRERKGQSQQSFFTGAQLTGCTINFGFPTSSAQTQQHITIDKN